MRPITIDLKHMVPGCLFVAWTVRDVASSVVRTKTHSTFIQQRGPKKRKPSNGDEHGHGEKKTRLSILREINM